VIIGVKLVSKCKLSPKKCRFPHEKLITVNKRLKSYKFPKERFLNFVTQ